jgi:hypothetical protein
MAVEISSLKADAGQKIEPQDQQPGLREEVVELRAEVEKMRAEILELTAKDRKAKLADVRKAKENNRALSIRVSDFLFDVADKLGFESVEFEDQADELEKTFPECAEAAKFLKDIFPRLSGSTDLTADQMLMTRLENHLSAIKKLK